MSAPKVRTSIEELSDIREVADQVERARGHLVDCNNYTDELYAALDSCDKVTAHLSDDLAEYAERLKPKAAA